MSILQADLACVQTPAPARGAALLWEGDEYRVIEAREFHVPTCLRGYDGGYECGHTLPVGRVVVLVERLLRTDALGGKAWVEADALPAEAVRAMLRALALGGAR